MDTNVYINMPIISSRDVAGYMTDVYLGNWNFLDLLVLM